MSSTAPPPHLIHVVGAAVIDGSQCLITQRSPEMSSPGKWEFPGGKVKAGESPESALAREILEELNLTIEVGTYLGNGRASAGNGVIISLDVYAATIIGGTLQLAEHSDHAWIDAQQLGDFDWADADRPILNLLRCLLEEA